MSSLFVFVCVMSLDFTPSFSPPPDLLQSLCFRCCSLQSTTGKRKLKRSFENTVSPVITLSLWFYL